MNRHARVGLGWDSHRLAAGRPLVLGGVRLPFEKGLVGHTDADALAHAVVDALLGAAGLGDIGGYFPDTDPHWKDADSLRLLEHAANQVRQAGWQITNVDAVVMAEAPPIAPHREPMIRNLARAMGLDAGRVSVKAKTAEGLDAVGRGESIAVHAVALLERE